MSTESSVDPIVAVATQFFTPRRQPPRDWSAGQAKLETVQIVPAPPSLEPGPLEIAVHHFGAGPKVLLVHGWEGQAMDLDAVVEPLIARGLSVVAPDLPAHGRSSGKRMSIPLAAQMLQRLPIGEGGWHGAIAHSMGGAILGEAMAQGLHVGRVAMVAPPTHYGDRARAVGRMVGLDDAAVEALIAELSRLVGVSVDEVVLASRAKAFRQPALLIHSRDDKTVTTDELRGVAKAWTDARLVQVDGLGHRRILQDPDVIRELLEFLDGSAQT